MCCHRPLLRVTALILGVSLTAAALPLSLGHAAEQRKPTVEKIEYKGWKNNLRLSNGQVEVILTLDVGPRIISYRLLPDGKNVMKEFADQLGKTGEPEWQSRGGHRLWLGPEDRTRTYAPDNGPVQYKELGAGHVRLTPAPEKEYGIQKEMDVQLAPNGTQVTVVHRVKNIGEKPTDLAIWALTVLDSGGVEIIPLPAKRPHPGPPKNAKADQDFWPNQLMVVWPFTDFADGRWTFGSKYILLRQDGKKGPTKIGLAHALGWIAYLNQGNLFVKRFDFEQDKTYPDFGVNYETFTNEDMLESETLGPLVRLAPQATAETTERWELFKGVPAFKNEGDIDKNILPLVKPK